MHPGFTAVSDEPFPAANMACNRQIDGCPCQDCVRRRVPGLFRCGPDVAADVLYVRAEMPGIWRVRRKIALERARKPVHSDSCQNC